MRTTPTANTENNTQINIQWVINPLYPPILALFLRSRRLNLRQPQNSLSLSQCNHHRRLKPRC